jgi:hypothetical protein
MPASFETSSMETTGWISECSTYPSSTPSTSSSSSTTSSEPYLFPSWNVIRTTTPVNTTPTVTIPQPLTLPVMFHICHATPTTTAASSSNIVVVTPRDDDDPSTTLSSTSSASSSSSMVPIQSMEDCRPSFHENPKGEFFFLYFFFFSLTTMVLILDFFLL